MGRQAAKHDEISVDEMREWLTDTLMSEDPSVGLWAAVDSGFANEVIPELPALRLEQDPIHRHKDVLTHTIVVTRQAPAQLDVRMAALFHDIGKPKTRRIGPQGVTFRHHEAVGAKMTRKRLRHLGFEPGLVDTVAELVRLSGRFKGYGPEWTDSAVRRYARDAGALLPQLNGLIRADCTTKSQYKADRLQSLVDHLEDRIKHLAEVDAAALIRPVLDGSDVMRLLEIEPGPDVGRAMDYLTDLQRSESLDLQETTEALLSWWAQKNSN